MNKIKCVIVNPASRMVTIDTIEDSLDTFYKIIGTDVIDITDRIVGGLEMPVSIICDDEGLLKRCPRVSAVNTAGEPQLVGTIIVSKSDYESGELVSLTDEEAEYVTSNIRNHCVLANVNF